MSPNKDDLDVILSAQRGDEEAWSNLVTSYSKLVWSATSKYYSQFNNREDIVQEVFTRLVKSIKSYNPDKSRFSTFLTIIAKRVCIDKLRKDKIRPDEFLPLESLEKFPVLNKVKSDSNEAKEKTIKKLCEKMKELSTEKRLVISLFYLKGHSYKEIADIMHRDFNWVKNSIHRTRIFLKQNIDKSHFPHIKIP